MSCSLITLQWHDCAVFFIGCSLGAKPGFFFRGGLSRQGRGMKNFGEGTCPMCPPPHGYVPAFRHLPSIIYSDNALMFKAASCKLKLTYRLLRDVQLQNFCASSNIMWKFIAKSPSWWGGHWEKMIQTVKNCPRKGCVSFDTLLTEVEAAINSRPISHISDDAAEAEVPYLLAWTHYILITFSLHWTHYIWITAKFAILKHGS